MSFSSFSPVRRLFLFRRLCTSSARSPPSSRRALGLEVKRLVKSRRFSEVEALVESHKKGLGVADEPYLASIISAYAQARMVDHAVRTFEQMDDLGVPRSALSLNAVLSACNRCRAFDRVPQLFSEVPRKYGIAPNEISYGILIKALCDSGSPESAHQLLDEMKDRNLNANMIIYTTLLDGFYKKDMIEESERIWEEMSKSGNGPDVTAYNVRIMHEHGGKPEEVLGLMKEMLLVGLKPDITSYNYLMTCYCRNNQMEDAKKVYGDLWANGCWANGSTFRVFLFYLCRKGDFDTGLKIFRTSVKRNRMPNFSTVKPLVVGLAKSSKVKEAKEVIGLAKQKCPEKDLNAWRDLEVEMGLDEGKSSDVTEASI